MFTDKELGKLANQTSSELAQRWKGMKKKLAAKDTITIANTGLVNSGKSSLFNALLADKLDTERFPVGGCADNKAWRSGAFVRRSRYCRYTGY